MLFLPSRNPKLVKGMKSGKKIKVIPQDPNIKNSIPVMRSNNQRGGVEFTWTIWLYIDTLNYKLGQRKHIFHKGSDTFARENKWPKTNEGVDVSQMAFPNNSPGLFISENSNELIVTVNTFEYIFRV